eukprot:m.47907 g.47907  ORF g.47907 m.47907 type:complete len:338 (-) comp11954_c0_seq3:44-1057(-)
MAARGRKPPRAEQETSSAADGEDAWSSSASSSWQTTRVSTPVENISVVSHVTVKAAGDRVTFYRVECMAGPYKWFVYRRYSEFRRLHRAVHKLFPSKTSRPFPPKRMVNNFSDEFLKERRNLLLAFLRNVTLHPDSASHPAVMRFLSCQGDSVPREAHIVICSRPNAASGQGDEAVFRLLLQWRHGTPEASLPGPPTGIQLAARQYQTPYFSFTANIELAAGSKWRMCAHLGRAGMMVHAVGWQEATRPGVEQFLLDVRSSAVPKGAPCLVLVVLAQADRRSKTFGRQLGDLRSALGREGILFAACDANNLISISEAVDKLCFEAYWTALQQCRPGV